MFGKDDKDDESRVWDLIEKIGFCMLASRDGEDIRSRPMAAQVEREEGRILFLTDKDSFKEEEIARDPNVNLAFADPSGQDYVSLTGRAALSDDRARIRDLWSPAAKAWWDGPDDPSIRLLSVAPKDAQYWEGPGTLRAYVKMAAAALSSARPDLGDNAKVDMAG